MIRPRCSIASCVANLKRQTVAFHLEVGVSLDEVSDLVAVPVINLHQAIEKQKCTEKHSTQGMVKCGDDVSSATYHKFRYVKT